MCIKLNEKNYNMKYIITEEQHLKLRLMRRLSDIDDSIPSKMKEILNWYNICKMRVDNFLDAVIGGIISDMYYAYFSDIDDNSKEWDFISKIIEEYVNLKFGHQIADFYFQTCNN